MEIITTPKFIIKNDYNFVYSVAFHPTEPLIGVGYDNSGYGPERGTAKLWRMDTLRRRVVDKVTLKGHSASVRSIAFHPTKPLILTASEDSSARLWCMNQSSTEVECYDTINFHENTIDCVAFHPTELLFATASWDHSVKIWQITEINCGRGINIEYIKGIFNHTKEVNSVAFHPTEPLILTGSRDQTAILWRIINNNSGNKDVVYVTTLEARHNWLEDRGIVSVAFNPTEPLILTGSNDFTARLWKMNEERTEVECVLTLDGRGVNYNYVAFHPTKPIFAFGCSDATVKFWRMNPERTAAECVATINAHRIINDINIYSIAFHPTEPLFASGAGLTAKVWQLNDQGLPVNYNPNTNLQNRHISMRPEMRPEISIRRESWGNLIKIPKIFLNPPITSGSNSCPSFINLYDGIMKLNLKGTIQFKIDGNSERGIDAGGIKRSIFEKLLYFYTNKFFQKIPDNDNFVILKPGLNMKNLNEETTKLILLAKAAQVQIFLKIDPRLLKLFLSVNPKQFINNTKQEYQTLIKNTEDIINFSLDKPNYNKKANVTNYFITNNQNNKNSNNSIIKKYKNVKNLQNEDIKSEIKKQIYFRRLTKQCGFNSWDEFNTMLLFIQTYWENGQITFINQEEIQQVINIFTNQINFDKKNILDRLIIKRKIGIDTFENIDISRFITGNSNSNIRIHSRNNSNTQNYPLLIPLLNFIFGSESNDKNRELFVTYVTGSSTSPASLTIVLDNTVDEKYPFKPHTCFNYIELFKRTDRDRLVITDEFIKLQFETEIRNSSFGFV